MRLSFIAFFVFIFTASSQATVTITQISSGYSRLGGRLANEVNETLTTVYGGIAGDLCASTTGTTTCNNCSAVAAEQPCNSRRIYNDLVIRFDFKYENPGTESGRIRMAFNDDTYEELDLYSSSTSAQVSSNGTYFASVRWGEICDKVYGTPDCESVGDTSPRIIRIGISSNGTDQLDDAAKYTQEIRVHVIKMDNSIGQQTLCNLSTPPSNAGACNFAAIPGDSKVFIEDVQAGCSFPALDSGGDIRALRVFYSEAPDIPDRTSTFRDLVVGDTSGTCDNQTRSVSMQENIVDDLTNDITYVFAIGALDEANNIGYVTDMSGVEVDVADSGSCYDPDGPSTEGASCHVATPGEVLGLIDENMDCFITTATYGSPMSPQVEDFRQFRNRFLHPHWLGQKIIGFYYRTSPPIAHWIRNHPEVKPVVRVLLFPLWLIAKLCIEFPVTFILFVLSTVLLFGFNRLRRGVHP